ncbi:hypothetical protein BT93_E1828 [Corymbia citriodora subsp. variegata]|nr:hypothetical protein BT93_E1828 [Corymbia citriodora subsp. variegata]
MAGTLKQTGSQKDDEDYISLLPDGLIHHIFSFLCMRDIVKTCVSSIRVMTLHGWGKVRKFHLDINSEHCPLNDDLIEHIFSFLPTRDVVKTCVLSSRWRSYWPTVLDLRFSVSSPHDSFVDRVLKLYGRSKVRKFHLDINSKSFCPSKIDSWVGFAIDHQVEELLLDFNIWCVDCPLSPLLYNCSSLTNLRLSGCCFPFIENISWSSLQSLSIHDMDVSDDLLRKILMGSPVLEYLNLEICWGIKGIRSTSLKELVIESIGVEFPLHISTPQLLSLRVRGFYFDKIISIVEAPSLLEAELDFDGPIKSDFCWLKKMLFQLQNATRVLFGPSCVQVMCAQIEDVQVSLPNCKSLTLHVAIPEFSFSPIANMLATIPNLEKLNISDLDSYNFDDSCNLDHTSYGI